MKYIIRRENKKIDDMGTLTLLRFCVGESSEGRCSDLNTNLVLLGKWSRSSPAVGRALFACFLLFFVKLPACKVP